MIGTALRLKRLFSSHSKNTIIVPLDHGVSFGSIAGLEKLSHTAQMLAHSGKVDALLGHRRLFTVLAGECVPDVGRILHISANTRCNNTTEKVLVASVEDAITLGADAVSVHINLGEAVENRMLKDLGSVVGTAMQYGLPVLAMMYVRTGSVTSFSMEDILLSARVADDIGVDIIKVPYTGSPESFARVVEACSAPLVLAGGEKCTDVEGLLQIIDGALSAGAKGLSIGRNIFGAEYPMELLDAIHLLVHRRTCVESVCTLYKTSIAHKERC